MQTDRFPADGADLGSDSACLSDVTDVGERGGHGVQGGPSVRSESLFQGAKVVHIHHEGAVYQLRTTKLGKLILTK